MLTWSPQSQDFHTKCNHTPIIVFYFFNIEDFFHLHLFKLCHSTLALCNTSANLKLSISKFSYKILTNSVFNLYFCHHREIYPQHLYKLWHLTRVLCSTNADLKSSIFKQTSISIYFSTFMNSFLYFDMDFSSTPHWGDYLKVIKMWCITISLVFLLKIQLVICSRPCICHLYGPWSQS